MNTIGKLALEFGISRSTLLYYDSIGLLKPDKRSEKRDRLYDETERQKLEQIIAYRQMKIPLKEIQKMLTQPENKSISILKKHLVRLSDEIRNLRKQQHAIMKILKDDSISSATGIMDKETWKQILRSAGLDNDGMFKWHAEFEKSSPQAHHDFLISIGLSESELKYLRKTSSDYIKKNIHTKH